MAEKKKIVLVDDNATNLTMCNKTLKDLYDVYPAKSTDMMFDILKHVIPDLILLDVEMPGTNGYEAVRLLKGYDTYADIPIIFLSAMDDAQSEMEGLNLGAVDYIHKPFISALLIKRIETHISVIEGKKKLIELNKSIEELLSQKTDVVHQHTDEEAIRELVTKSEYYAKMGHELRAPLCAIIEMIETAIKLDDIGEIKHYLSRADTESRLMLEIVNDIFDTPSAK